MFFQRDKLNSEIIKLFEAFEKNPPINSVVVQQIANAIKLELPSDYLEIFSFMNGGEGFISNEYCRLYPLDELISLNESFSVKEFAPEILVFGSNGGGGSGVGLAIAISKQRRTSQSRRCFDSCGFTESNLITRSQPNLDYWDRWS